MPSAQAGEGENAARSRHVQGVNAALCDGSVQFFHNTITPVAWQLMGSINDGQAIPPYE
jgi:prepilin-type processing-associated H-X9-DG protein